MPITPEKIRLKIYYPTKSGSIAFYYSDADVKPEGADIATKAAVLALSEAVGDIDETLRDSIMALTSQGIHACIPCDERGVQRVQTHDYRAGKGCWPILPKEGAEQFISAAQHGMHIWPLKGGSSFEQKMQRQEDFDKHVCRTGAARACRKRKKRAAS